MKHRILTAAGGAFLLSVSLLLVLVACGGPENAGTSSPPSLSVNPSPPPSEASPSPLPSEANPSPLPSEASPSPLPSEASPSPLPSEASPSPLPSEASPSPLPSETNPGQKPKMEDAFRAALEGIYSDHLYPNGDQVDTPELSKMENNQFALYDVDGDGKTELVYRNSDATMAGMITNIYGFDPDAGELCLELSGFSGMNFYDNGAVSIAASHNHGLSASDNFWPYSLYRYDPGSDSYLLAGSVDAWDGTKFPQNHDGESFPNEVDSDGDGFIYLLTTPGAEVTTTRMDNQAYQEWRDSCLAGATELELPWRAMTLENIQAIAA